MKRHKMTALTSFGIVCALSVTVNAASIGINFEGLDSNGAFPNLLAPGDSAGVVPQTNWNNGSGFTNTITDADDDGGNPTTLDVNWGGQATWSWERSGRVVPANGNGTLFNGYLDTTGNNGSHNINVDEIPYALYDVYLYVDGENFPNSRPARANVNGGTDFFVDDTANWNGVFVQATDTVAPGTAGANYMKFSNLTDSSIDIFVEAETFRAAVNGFQIVEVPEPSSFLLAGFGLLMSALFIRRRKR